MLYSRRGDIAYLYDINSVVSSELATARSFNGRFPRLVRFTAFACSHVVYNLSQDIHFANLRWDSRLWQRFSRFPRYRSLFSVSAIVSSWPMRALYLRGLHPAQVRQRFLGDLHMKRDSLVSRSLPARASDPVASPAVSPSREAGECSLVVCGNSLQHLVAVVAMFAHHGDFVRS